ncbi:MAG: YdbH domain-containing protein [Halopseudomonas aestusnigri]
MGLEKKYWRKICKIVLGLGLVVILAGGLVAVYRISIAQYFLEQVAQQAKVPHFKAQIVDISYNKISLEELAAGDAAEFSLGSLQLNFDLIELWRGGVLEVNIDRLKLSLDVTGNKPLLGSLGALLSGEGDGVARAMPTLPFQPQVHLTNSELNITAEPGLIYLPLAAEVIGTSEDNVQGWVSFEGGKLGDSEPEEFSLSMIFSSSDLQLDWDINWQEIGFEGEGAASLFLDDPGLNWNIFGNIAGSLPVAFLGKNAPAVKSINGEIKLDGVGEISVFGAVPKRWRSAIEPLLIGLNSATADLSVETQTRILLHNGVLIESNIPLEIMQKGEKTLIGLYQDAVYSVVGLEADQSLSPEIRSLLGTEFSGEVLKDGTSVSFQLTDEQPYTGEISGKAEGQTGFDLEYKGAVSGYVDQGLSFLNGTQGTLELVASKIALPQVNAAEVSINVDALYDNLEGWKGGWKSAFRDLIVEQQGVRSKEYLQASSRGIEGRYRLNENVLSVAEGHGNILVSSLFLPEKLEATSPISVDVERFDTTIELPSSANDAVILKELNVNASVEALNVHLIEARQKVSAMGLQAGLAGGSDDVWRVKAAIREVILPGLKLKFGKVSSTFTTPFTPLGLPDDISKTPFEANMRGQVKSEDEALALPEGQFSAAFKGNLQKVKVDVEAGLLEGATLLTLKGKISPRTLDGAFDVVLPELLFTEGGIQPATFSPVLSDVKVQSGTFSGNAEIVVKNGKPDGHGYINLDIDEALISDLPVRGLEGRFFFQGITEPSLPPGQSLKIKELDAGVPLTNIALLFGASLEQDQPVVDLRNAGLNIAGGQVQLKPDIFHVLEENLNLEVQVSELDVKELFALIGRKDLSGTGLLSGQIPIRLEGEQVVIKGGHLSTDGPGVLQIRSQVIADALASGGEQVGLLIKALQNFNYTELTLDIEKPLNGAAQVKLGISGANKDVLEGHAFRLNINLETRIEPLLEVLLQGQKISKGLVSGFLKKR